MIVCKVLRFSGRIDHSRVLSVLLIQMCSVTSAIAGTEPSECQQTMHPDSTFYYLGKSAARREAGYPGTFLTGLFFGTTLPFVSGGCASLAYRSTGKIGIVGIAGAITGAVLWTKGGSMLIRRPIAVPAHHHANLGENDRYAFDAGYIETAQEKRMSRYTAGVFMSSFFIVIFVIGALSSIGQIGE